MKRIEELNTKINIKTNEIAKLDNVIISKTISLWNYKQPEVILLDEEYGSSFSIVVQLNNITEDVLKFLKPIAYITSSNGWADLGSLTDRSFSSSFYYDIFIEEKDYGKLYLSGTASAFTKMSKPIPIYWTVKLYFNPILQETVI